MIMSDLENLHHVYFLLCVWLRVNKKKHKIKEKILKIHNNLAKSVHYLILTDIKEFTNNKLKNELEINNIFLEFKISSVSLSESEKEISEDSFDFLKNALNQVDEKLILDFEKKTQSLFLLTAVEKLLLYKYAEKNLNI